jgi:hypothetical protein
MPQKIVSKQLNRCLGVWFWLKSLLLVGYAMDYVMSFGFDHFSALFHVFHTSVLLPVWRSKVISKLNIIFGSSCKDVLLWIIAVSFSQSLLKLYSGEAIPAKAAVALCTGRIKSHLSSEQLLLDYYFHESTEWAFHATDVFVKVGSAYQLCRFMCFTVWFV